jgi:hypothetical protein
MSMTADHADAADPIELLAELSGERPDAIRHQPKALGRAMLALGETALSIARGHASEDDATRAAARARWQALADRLSDASPGEPGATPASSGLGPTGRARLNRVLRKIVDELEDLASAQKPE